MTNKEKYIRLCNEKPIPFFMQAWWIEADCADGKKWNVLLYEKNGEILGAWPYHILKKLGFKIIVQLPHDQYNGIWINYPQNMTPDKKWTFDKEIMDHLIDQLERKKIHYFHQYFHFSFTNWQPFYWKGYSATTYYTFQIKDISDTEKVYNSFSYAKKKQIKKTLKNFTVVSLDPIDFYKMHKRCLLKKGKKIWYSQTLFKSLYEASKLRGQGEIVALRDGNNIVHAALFVVWDKMSAYDLISAIDPDYKSSGASTRIVWEAIKMVSKKTKIFDFEGSMFEGVARSFQQFGTEQTHYFSIEKSKSRALSLLLKIKKRFHSD